MMVGKNALSQSIYEAGERMADRRERHRDAQEALAAAEGFDRVYREMDKLRLHLACVTALLIRSGAVSKQTYRKMVEAIDAADGVADGAFSGIDHRRRHAFDRVHRGRPGDPRAGPDHPGNARVVASPER